MSLIPWITKAENPGEEVNIVATRDKLVGFGGFNAKVVLVHNLDDKQFGKRDDGSYPTNASYDLRVGETYFYYKKPTLRHLNDGDFVEIRPGAAAVIKVEEQVYLPSNIFGLILPRHSLLQQGLDNTATKLDPGYYGELHVTVVNHGRNTVRLQRKSRFCALCLFDVRGPVRPYDQGDKGMRGVDTAAWRTRFIDWWHRNHGWIIPLAAAILSSLLTLLGSYVLGEPPRP
jgi:deoxycytidine triphosphate deaminase